ncbi:MAG: DUF523 and DUF1722 domain-containing protein [Candidatus Methanomethylicaceae archaeon]
MLKHPKPRLVVSACLGFKATRYDGSIIHDEIVNTLREFADLLPICPEVEIGLEVPRKPLVITKDEYGIHIVSTEKGEDFSNRMEDFAKSFINKLVEIDGFIMKSKSPSCGVGDSKIYGKGGAVVGRINGIFTKLVREAFPLLPFESEKRLLNYEIRRNFLTKIFTIADLRETLPRAKAKDLIELHRRNKYVLMLYNPHILKSLGRLIAEIASRDLNELKESYRRMFLEALSKNPGRASYANVFTHLYSHIKDDLTNRERSYILTLIEDYRKGRNLLKTLIIYFRGFIYRLGNEYLAEQRFIEPYPEKLDKIEEQE